MVKFFLVTILISLASTTISAQIEKDAIVEKINSNGLNSKKPSNLKSVTVLKDQVNEILFRPNPSSRKDGIIINCKCSQKRVAPVVLINGEISSNGLNNIDPNKIKNITIIKDQSTSDINNRIPGVILIKTKDGPNRFNKREPLVIIDGVTSKKGVESIDPRTVKSITVLQDQASKDSHGKASENGIIVVTTTD